MTPAPPPDTDGWHDDDGDDDYVVPPSFEPWLGRIQMARAVVATLALVLVSTWSFNGGFSGQDALVRGIVAAMAGYFVAWTASLLIFGELYEADLRRRMDDLRRQRDERARQMEAMYRERLRSQGLLVDGTPDPAAAAQAGGNAGGAAQPGSARPTTPAMQPGSFGSPSSPTAAVPGALGTSPMSPPTTGADARRAA